MSTSINDAVFTAALGLSAESRAALAEKLLESLDSTDRAALDAAWAQEAERRIGAFDNGTLRSQPIEDVLKTIRQPHSS